MNLKRLYSANMQGDLQPLILPEEPLMVPLTPRTSNAFTVCSLEIICPRWVRLVFIPLTNAQLFKSWVLKLQYQMMVDSI